MRQVRCGRGVATPTKRGSPCGIGSASRCNQSRGFPLFIVACPCALCLGFWRRMGVLYFSRERPCAFSPTERKDTMLNLFKNSALEMKSTKNLTLMGMLLALSVVLSFFSIQVNQYVKVGFTMLPMSVLGMFFGPVPAALAGAARDIIGYLIKPSGVYFPGFTFNALLGGMFYGLLFYKGQAKLWRVLVAKALIMAIINVGFTSVWLYILYQQAVSAYLPMRLVKNLIMYPIECAMVYGCLVLVKRLQPRLARS